MSKKSSRQKVSVQAKNTKSPPKEWHGLWDRQSSAKQHLIAALLLLVVSVAFYAPIHFSGKQIIAGDTINWRGMAESMIEFEEETGEVALWAGRTFAGMPGYMISPELTIPQVDVIMKELRLLIWPTSHLMLLFLGMYWLAWYVTRSSIASIFGAIAYGLTTYMPVILVAGHNSKFIALAWAPWLFLAFIHAMKKQTFVSGLLFAVALAANLRAGHVQITYYVTFAAGIWWVNEGISAIKSGSVQPFLKATGMLVVGSILGLMMVAEPYLAHAELAPYTTRGSGTGGMVGGMAWTYAMNWSQGIGELLTLFISDAFGGAGSTYWGPKTFTGGPHYFGAIVLALGGLAVWKVKDRTTVSLAVGAVLLTLFSLGENFAVLNRPMFNYFPMFSAFRVPETWLSIVAMLVALLAARGVANLPAHPTGKLFSMPSVRVLSGALGLAVFFLVFGSSVLSFEKPSERDQMLAQIQRQYPNINPSDPQVESVINQEISTRQSSRIEAFKSDTGRTAFLLIIALAIVVLLYRGTLPTWAAALSLCVLIGIDLGGVGRRYLNEDVLSVEKSVQEKVPLYGFDSYLLDQKNAAGGDGSFRVLSLEFGMALTSNARPSFYYESMGGYSAAKLRNYQDLLDHVLFTGTGTGINPAALDMLNIRYVVVGQEIPGLTSVFQDEQTGMHVLENPSALDRAFLVDYVSFFDTAESAWERLGSLSFNPASEAVVINEGQDLTALTEFAPNAAGSDSTESSASDSMTQESVSTRSYSAQDMVFEVETESERLLVISEVYYKPGWKATVNGEETTIYAVDQLLRGVIVPPGKSEVHMFFEPPSFDMGRLISGLGTLFTYGLLLFFGFMAWRKNSSTSPLATE